MKKTYGGFLGAKMAHKKKVKRVRLFAFAIAMIMSCATVFSMDNASIFSKISTGTVTAGVMLGGVMIEDPTPEQILLSKMEATVNQIVKEGGDATKAELKILKAAIESLQAKPDTSKEMKEEIIRLSGEINALKESAKPVTTKGHGTLKEALTAALTANKEKLDKVVADGGKQKEAISIVVKSAGTMSVESTIGAGSTQVSITEDTGIISTIRKRELRYLAEVSVGRISTNRAMWIEETDEEGTPIFIGEGDTKTQLDVQYIERTESVKKCAVHGKITTELMADIPQLVSYIQNNLMRRMDIVIENDLFSGSGVGDNIKGLFEYDTAFTGGALAGTIKKANELDVIEGVALQVKTGFGMPGAIFIHPSTMSKIKLIKDENGRPVWKDYVTINGEMVVSGMKIVETTAVNAGEFIGGDTKVANVLIREDLVIEIGRSGDDMINNKKTMLLEKRLVQFVSANDVPVIISGDFDTAIDLLQEA